MFELDYFINAYIMFLSLVHPFLTGKSFSSYKIVGKALELLACVDDGAGNYFMFFNPVQECFVPSWYKKLPVTIIALVVYGLGIPLLFFAILWRQRKNLSDPKLAARLGSVFVCYSQPVWYFEVIVKLR